MERKPLLHRLQPPVAFASAIGFALSLAIHIGTFLYPRANSEAVFLPVFAGIFLVWFPTAFYVQKFNSQRWTGLGFGAWKELVEGAPPALVWLMGASFVYAIVNFFLSAPEGPGREASYTFARMGSGHAMTFYSAALALNYAAVRRRAIPSSR